MRIMLDTNVLVSAAIFPHSRVANTLFRTMQEHTLIICTYVLEELQSVFERKFPDQTGELDAFFTKLAYELCYTPKVNENTPDMRDEDDRSILQAAIDAEADVILTGDKDFHALNLDRPMIISPADIMHLFG